MVRCGWVIYGTRWNMVRYGVVWLEVMTGCHERSFGRDGRPCVGSERVLAASFCVYVYINSRIFSGYNNPLSLFNQPSRHVSRTESTIVVSFVYWMNASLSLTWWASQSLAFRGTACFTDGLTKLTDSPKPWMGTCDRLSSALRPGTPPCSSWEWTRRSTPRTWMWCPTPRAPPTAWRPSLRWKSRGDELLSRGTIC